MSSLAISDSSRPRSKLSPSAVLDNPKILGAVLLLPTFVFLGLFAAYPFVAGVLLAFSNTLVGAPGNFVGLETFEKIWADDVFRKALTNTFIYTIISTIFRLVLGLWLAVLLNRHFRGKTFVRAFILLPFIIPTVLSTYAWKWMFDPTFSVLNWMFYNLGLITGPINWLGEPNLAMGAVIIANIWRGIPFFAITLLAGLQTIGPELQEAASIDGARPLQRFWYVTWPLLLPVTIVLVLFSVIQAFFDFQVVYVMTGGGPVNATEILATYAYRVGVGIGQLGQGAAISLSIFPMLVLIVVLQLMYVRRVENN